MMMNEITIYQSWSISGTFYMLCNILIILNNAEHDALDKL